jgi:hypothetical protein
MRLHALPSLAILFTCACGTPTDVVDETLAVAEECTSDCTAESEQVGTRRPLISRAHGVMGAVVVIDDRTIALEDFAFDGGGVDVRAIVASTIAGLGDDDDRVLLSDDLRRPGGYVGARLTLPLPEGLTVDDIGAFSVWCVPFSASFGDVAWDDDP